MGICGILCRGGGSNRTDGNLRNTYVDNQSFALHDRRGIYSRQSLSKSLSGTSSRRQQVQGSMCPSNIVCIRSHADRRIDQPDRWYISTLSLGKPTPCRMVCMYPSDPPSMFPPHSFCMIGCPFRMSPQDMRCTSLRQQLTTFHLGISYMCQLDNTPLYILEPEALRFVIEEIC